MKWAFPKPRSERVPSLGGLERRTRYALAWMEDLIALPICGKTHDLPCDITSGAKRRKITRLRKSRQDYLFQRKKPMTLRRGIRKRIIPPVQRVSRPAELTVEEQEAALHAEILSDSDLDSLHDWRWRVRRQYRAVIARLSPQARICLCGVIVLVSILPGAFLTLHNIEG